MAELTLIRVWPRNPTSGVEEPWCLAGGGKAMPYYRDGLHYKAGVSQPPRFSASLSFGDQGWSGGVVPTVAAITYQPGDPRLLDQLHALYWKGAAIEVDLAIEGGASTRRLTGTVSALSEQDSALSITATDLSKALEQSLATGTFAGTGGIEGESAAEGRVKRRSWGRVFNVEGQLLNTAYSIYEFGDPGRQLQGCTALRDKGREGVLHILGWQGSIEATFEALKNSEAPQGGGVFAPSIACAKWWTTPAGPLTADLLGEIGDGYGASVAAIASAVSAALSGPLIADLDVAIALRSAEAGWHVNDASTTGSAVLDQMLAGAGLFWVLDPVGHIQIREWTWDGEVTPLAGLYLGREAQYAPHKSRKLGYCRNEHQHSDGDIAADIPADDVAYKDGTPVESLKPAQPGADVTGDNTAADTAAVGGKPSSTLLAELAAVQSQADTIHSDLDAAVADIEATTGALQAQATAAAGAIEAQGGEIDSLQTLTTAQGASIASNATAISNAAGDLATLTERVSTAESSVTTVTQALATTDLQVASVQSDLATANSAISSNQQAISGLQSSVAMTEQRLTAGSQNLLPNGSFEKGLAGYSSVNPYLAATSGSGWGSYAVAYLPDNLSGYFVYFDSPLIATEPGATMTVSADFALWTYAGEDASVWFEVFEYGPGGTTVTAHYVAGPRHYGQHNFGGNRIEATFTVGTGTTGICIRPVAASDSGRLKILGWRQIKVERSSFATAYSSEASVSMIAAALTTAEGKQAAYLEAVAAAGGSSAAVRLVANGQTSGIELQADAIRLGDDKKAAVDIVNGTVLFHGEVLAESITTQKLKIGGVTTEKIATAAVNGITSYKYYDPSYVWVNYPDPTMHTLNFVFCNQVSSFSKSNGDSDLLIRYTYIGKSENDLIILSKPQIYVAGSGTVAWGGVEEPGIGLVSDGSRPSIATIAAMYRIPGLPAGSYDLKILLAGASGMTNYPTGNGLHKGAVSYVEIQEIKR